MKQGAGDSNMTNELILTTPLPRQLAAIAPALPSFFTVNEKTAKGFVDYFTATIRNRDTRWAYFNAGGVSRNGAKPAALTWPGCKRSECRAASRS
jgi:hypothetical protein